MTSEGRSRGFWLVLAAGLLVLLVLGLWLGRPAYRSYKEQRALARAEVFLEEGDLPNAVLSLRQVLALNPDNVAAIDAMAGVAATTGSPQVLAWRKRAADLDPSVENRLRLVDVAIRVEPVPFPIARATLDALAPLSETNVAFHQLATRLALRLNRLVDAERHLQTVTELDPTNQLHQLNLATLQLQAADWAKAQMARDRLGSLAGNTNLSALALRSLVSDALRRERPSEAQEMMNRLLLLKPVPFPDHLLHLTVLDTCGAPELPRVLEQTRERAGTNIATVLPTVAWMVQHQRPGEALAWVESLPESLRNTPVLLLARAECYLGAKDWRGLETWLEGQDWQQQECVRLTLLSKALREEGRREVGDAHWRRAIGAAGSQPQAIMILSRLAAGWQWDSELENLLWSATEGYARTEWAFKALGSFYESRTNTAGLYRLHQALLEKEPDSLILQNNTAMIALLLGRDLEEAGSLARNVYTAAGTNEIFASTYAYALHLQGQTDQALALMGKLTENQLNRPQVALYQAVMLQAAGRVEESAQYVPAARRAPLMLPEEAALLKTLDP